MSKKSTTFAPAFAKWYMVHVQMVNDLAGWMSDLVSGLQNRTERFDSATGLTKKVTPTKSDFFVKRSLKRR